MDINTKHWIFSKTLWFSFLVGAIGVLQAVPQDALPPKAAGTMSAILGVLLFINRIISPQMALTTKKEEPTFNG
jgi:predicted membrane metal-binding protein